MNKKYRVQLSEAERKEVQEALVAEGMPPSIRKRCSVLLMADESMGKVPTQEEIAQRCGVSGVTVFQLVKDYATQGLCYCLRRQKHETPPRAPIASGEKEARIIALACVAYLRQGMPSGQYDCCATKWCNCKLWIRSGERPSVPR